jgi:trimeric autotransporter adhesin
MNLIPSCRRALALLAFGLTALAPGVHAQSVASLACLPAVIGGGSGITSTCTVRLGAPAPAGGAAVTLASSLTALAASVPRVTVPAGQTSASFAVATNARYRLEAGLPFNVAISATRVTTASATLNITAPPRPADFSSGVPPGARFAWQGSACGGIEPIGGRAGVLYQCSGPTSNAYGNCSVKQECPIGCRRVAPKGATLKDFCATTGPNPVAISKSYIVSGERVPASLVTEAVVGTRLTQGLPGAISNQGVVGGIGGVSVNAGVFPHDGGITIPSGSSSVGFAVATSVVPTPTFIDVTGSWGDAGSVITTNGRVGQTWLAIVPPEPAPALPLPTLGDFKITGGNPVVGGQGSIGQLDVSGVTSAGGPTLTLTSSHPNIAAVPATFTMPAGPVLGQQVPITTQPPAVDTAVTFTATDGRYSFSALLMVLAPGAPPLLQSVALAPTSVVGGASATGTVTLSTGAPSGGAVVALSTPLPAVAQLPASVTVPAGATSASFPITTTSVVETFSVNVFADLAGTGRQALLLVTPGVAGTTGLASLALTPTRVSGGDASTGTVTLAAAAPSGGAVVALVSSSSVVGVPASVTVPAGATSASFTVTTGTISIGINATITAAYAGTTRTATLSVCSSPGSRLRNCLVVF